MNHQPATGIDATIPPCGTPTNPESFRGWPPLIKMDEAVKAKVEQLLRGSQRPHAR